MNARRPRRARLAIVVSHPIQYYVPLYRRLAARDDLDTRVFFTWHVATDPVQDHGFRQPIAWDIPLMDGYAWSAVENVSADPGTHRFMGLRNPRLARDVVAWRPDVVHVTGWAWWSHLHAMRAFARRGIPVLFRGDSHLLDDPQRGLRWRAKHALLRRVFGWPRAFLYVGSANRAYYQAFGVGEQRLRFCPHSIDVARFSADATLEPRAREWRRELGIAQERIVVLFAGKLEPKKQPLELMHALLALDDPRFFLIMVGGGELQESAAALAASQPDRCRVLPFQNQSRMPLVYRLADVFVLPSSHGETWGLAVNEALASGRPVIVSDKVGCARDLVDDTVGAIFPAGDFAAFSAALQGLARDRAALARRGAAAAARSPSFDIPATEAALVAAVHDSLQP